MLFRNIKTGNIVATSDDDCIELMQRSPTYEVVEVSAESDDVSKPKVRKTPTAKKNEADRGE